MDKEKGIKVDITNTDPKYWDAILASEGLPGENHPNDLESFLKLSETDETTITSCEHCNPRTMCRQGCCSGSVAREVGQDVKIFKDPENGVDYEICQALTQNEEGKWRCDIHDDLPDLCKSFECDISIRKRLEETED